MLKKIVSLPSLGRSIAAIGWFLFSLFVLYLPAKEIPTLPFSLPHLDKGIHFLLFFIQFRLVAGLLPKNGRSTLLILIIGASWALLSEYLQATLTLTRSGDLADALADLSGVIAALSHWWLAPQRQ